MNKKELIKKINSAAHIYVSISYKDGRNYLEITKNKPTKQIKEELDRDYFVEDVSGEGFIIWFEPFPTE